MELQNTDWALITWSTICASILGLGIFLIVRYMLRQIKK